MGSVNNTNTKIDRTVRIFDKFYTYEANVPTQEYDAVYSYMCSVFTDKLVAANFAVTIFRLATTTGIPAMDFLQQIQGQSAMQLTLTLAYYLNGTRSPTTLLGVSVPVQPNYYAARNVLN